MSGTYVVEKIVGKSVIKGSVLYRVQWEGFPGEDTWEPSENCSECKQSVRYFEEALEIHLIKLKKKVRKGKVLPGEASLLEQIKSDFYVVEIDPDKYLKRNFVGKKISTSQHSRSEANVSGVKNDGESKDAEVLAYKPRLNVFHIKYHDGNQEYLDRAIVNKNFDQQVIQYYEKRIICNADINRQIAEKIPRFLDLPTPIKPSFVSDLMMRHEFNETYEGMIPSDPVLQDNSITEQIPETPMDHHTEQNQIPIPQPPVLHDPRASLPICKGIIDAISGISIQEKIGDQGMTHPDEATNREENDIFNEDDLDLISSLNFDMLDQNNSQDVMNDSQIKKIAQKLLIDPGPLPWSPMITPSHREQADEAPSSSPVQSLDERFDPDIVLEIFIDSSSPSEVESEFDPDGRFVIEYSDDEGI